MAKAFKLKRLEISPTSNHGFTVNHVQEDPGKGPMPKDKTFAFSSHPEMLAHVGKVLKTPAAPTSFKDALNAEAHPSDDEDM